MSANYQQRIGVGMNRYTGRVMWGWPHVIQSCGVIFTTHFGERVMRRYFGSNVPRLLGASNITEPDVLRFFQAVCMAIDMWEPRARIVKIDELVVGRDGHFDFRMATEYRPRGHLGDPTPEPALRTIRAYNHRGPWRTEAVQ